MIRRAFLIALILVAALSAFLLTGRKTATHSVRRARSAAARTAFRRANPCPATGSIDGHCPGYVIDHIKPLACGGDDAPYNMQWQTVEDGKAKDAVERKDCGK